MTAELTAEEIVTNILSSKEIIKDKKNNFYISNGFSLGEYLKKMPLEEIVQEPAIKEDSKYTFIDKSKWKF